MGAFPEAVVFDPCHEDFIEACPGRLLQSLAHGYPGVFHPGLDLNPTFSNIEGPYHSVIPEQLHGAGHRLNPTKQ